MFVLPIKRKWFFMILDGIKKEEYREIKPYYTKRFQTLGLLDENGNPTSKHAVIPFRNGYGTLVPYLFANVHLRIGTGNPEWGAEPNVKYYILEINSIPFANNYAVNKEGV